MLKKMHLKLGNLLLPGIMFLLVLDINAQTQDTNPFPQKVCEINEKVCENGECSDASNCRSLTDCNPFGTRRKLADGQCKCKAGIEGVYCDRCSPQHFYLHEKGCLECFCMGVTANCSSTTWIRDTVLASFSERKSSITLIFNYTHPTFLRKNSPISNGEIVYRDFGTRNNTFYWRLPFQFYDNKLTSYGGLLNYTLSNTPHSSDEKPQYNSPDVVLHSGNNMKLQHFRSIYIPPNATNNYSVPILEEYWQNCDDNKTISREDLLTALTNVTGIFIRATYYTVSKEAAISYISLDIAREATANVSGTRAWPVEHCQCPQGHKGLSCEDCASGFFKGEQGLCKPCVCNGLLEECNPLTGVCLNCRNNTHATNCKLYINKEFGMGDKEAKTINQLKKNESELRGEEKDTCYLPAEIGECQNYTAQWYFDTKEQRCRLFYYGGCGGSGNNFADEQSCISRCADDGAKGRAEPPLAEPTRTEAPPKETPAQFERGHCQLPKDNGDRHCNMYVVRYFYNVTAGTCETFTHTSCGGNENNFKTKEGCEQACGGRPIDVDVRGPMKERPSNGSRCKESPDYGTGGDEPAILFYYNPKQRSCEQFWYSGEGGNANRYGTEEECQRVCGSHHGVDVCRDEKVEGRCSESVPRFYYDARVHACYAFNYSGCEGNGNRFASSEECEQTCVERRQPESRVDPSDPISQDAYILGNLNDSQTVELDGPATLRCMAGGHPLPIVSWWRATFMMPLSMVGGDHSLHFTRVRLQDLGPYVCQAYSGAGKGVSRTVTLQAYGPTTVTSPEDMKYMQYIVDGRPPVVRPLIRPQPPVTQPPPSVSRPPVKVTVELYFPQGQNPMSNSNFSINCTVDGYPRPTVNWFKDDQMLLPTDRIHISDAHVLTVTGTIPSDSGRYKCLARNDQSEAFQEKSLRVEGVYVPPECTDNQLLAKCNLIVAGQFCNHKYYPRFCCRSCTLAGQINVSPRYR